MPDSLCNEANLKRPLGSLLMINWTLASQKWQSPSNRMILSIFSLTPISSLPLYNIYADRYNALAIALSNVFGFVGGANRSTTCPWRLMRNFVKFHFTSLLTKPVDCSVKD